MNLCSRRQLWTAASVFASFLLPPAAGAVGLRLPRIESWAYELQSIDPLEIAQSRYDLVVLDYALESASKLAMPPEIVDFMRRKPDGSRRFILAYMSIGEAENFRSYWRKEWLIQPPDWLVGEDPDWPGNYTARYWLPDWQALLFGNPDAYLDQILRAGFDGVYLDGIDAFERLKAERPTARTDMVDLIDGIAHYARARRQDFLIVPQNGEGILSDLRTLSIIDAFAREDLLYNEERGGGPNSPDDISDAVRKLDIVKRAGKPVLVVEYVSDPQLAAALQDQITDLGFVGYIAARSLRGLGPPAPPPPPPPLRILPAQP